MFWQLKQQFTLTKAKNWLKSLKNAIFVVGFCGQNLSIFYGLTLFQITLQFHQLNDVQSRVENRLLLF